MTDTKEKVPRKPGRPKGSVSTVNARQSRLKNVLLRHLEPLAVEAITTTAEVMRDEKSSGAVKLQASKFIIEKIANLIDEAYRKEKDQVEDPVDPSEDESERGAILSFTVVDGKKK